jgi:hypothetical protein
MSAQSGAKSATIGSAGAPHSIFRSAVSGAVIAIAVAATGCTPATTHVAGADPADPAARVAGVGYRSTVAPYTALRPSAPAPWRERNERVTPQPKNGRE